MPIEVTMNGCAVLREVLVDFVIVENLNDLKFGTFEYCLTKISIRAKRSISRVFSLFIVPSPFFVYCLTKISIRAKRSISRVFSLFIVPSPFLYIARTKAVLTGQKTY